MSQDSTQNIPQEATKLKKLAKVTARYMEMEQFKDSDHHTGYFCYNCIYFMKPNHCAIVTDEGADVYDKTSGEIAPHGICALWEPNKSEVHLAAILAAKENQTNHLLKLLRAFHVKCAMRNLTPENN